MSLFLSPSFYSFSLSLSLSKSHTPTFSHTLSLSSTLFLSLFPLSLFPLSLFPKRIYTICLSSYREGGCSFSCYIRSQTPILEPTIPTAAKGTNANLNTLQQLQIPPKEFNLHLREFKPSNKPRLNLDFDFCFWKKNLFIFLSQDEDSHSRFFDSSPLPGKLSFSIEPAHLNPIKLYFFVNA